jgi:hypothetical protein
MGVEYNIRYQPADRAAWDVFVARLENPVSNGWPAFAVELSERGVYFCDHGRSPAAAVALRRIMDEALSHGESVVIQEARPGAPGQFPHAADAASLLSGFEREEFWWVGWAAIPGWGRTELPLHLELEDGAGDLAPRQVAILRALLKHAEDLRAGFERALFAYYKAEIEATLDADTPRPAAPSDMWSLIGDAAIWIGWYFRTPTAIEFKMTFNCAWDEEHGLGVRFVDWTPAAFGVRRMTAQSSRGGGSGG